MRRVWKASCGLIWVMAGVSAGIIGCDRAAKAPQGAQATQPGVEARADADAAQQALGVGQAVTTLSGAAGLGTQGVHLPGALVETQWLMERAQGGVLVVDVRAAQDYANGHIPGAIWLDVGALDVAAAAHTKDVADEATVRAALGAVGVSERAPVVLYGGAADYRVAARAFWILELHSHPAVAVLNGGYEGWVAAALPTQREAVVRPATAYQGARKAALLADQATVRAASESGGATVLDARSASDYSGQTGPEAMLRLGHIPGALNIDVSATYEDRGGVRRLPMPDDLKALYEGALPPTGDVITYCNGGRSASLSYLALRAAGRQGVSVYDGSWGDWSSAGTTSVVTGPHPSAQPDLAQPADPDAAP